MAEASTSTLLSELDSVSSAIKLQLSYLPTAGPSSHLLHPLGPIPPPFLAPSLSHSLKSIHASALKLPATLDAAANPLTASGNSLKPAGQQDPSKHYLALLAESATSRAILNSAAAAVHHAQELYQRSVAHLPPPLPPLSSEPAGAGRTLADLEAVGAAVGLAGFKDEPAGATTQLSLGGKCVAIDLVVANVGGEVQSVKVAYALPAPVGQRENDAVARDLLEALSGAEAADEGKRAVALERWMVLLMEVNRLDVMAEASGRDAFKQATAMATSLRESAEASGTAVETRLLPSSCLKPRLLFHASPLARSSDEWAAAQASEWTDPGAVERVLGGGGVHTVALTLEEAATEGEATSDLPRFVARFSPGVPITKTAGRRVLEAVGRGSQPGSTAAAGLDSSASAAQANTTWFEDLIISTLSQPTAAITRFNSTDAFSTPFDDLAFAPSFTLAEAGTVPGYLCTDVRVSSPEQLSAVVEVLRAHLAINDLLESVFTPELRVPRASAGQATGKAISSAPVALDDLFAASTSPTLPVEVHLAPTARSPAPAVALSFPSPHTPPHAAFPITLALAVEEAGAQVKLSLDVPEGAEGEQVRTRLDLAELESVVTQTRDLALLVRAVGRRLLSA